jgi:GNAT superfamily N-acetyltransferase
MIPQPLSLMLDILRISNRSRNSIGYVAEHETGRILGGILVLRDETQWSYGWAANVTSPDVERLGLGTLLVGAAIADAAKSRVPVFSFGASPLTHEGLRAFKRGWGAEEHEVYDYHWREPPRRIDLHQGFELAKQVVSIAPIPLLKALSPVVVRLMV